MRERERHLREPDEILRAAAEQMKRQWPGMTLRAVAGKLEITPSYWSKVLRGKKPLAPKLLPRIAKVLGLDSQQMAELQRSLVDSLELHRLAPVTGLRVATQMPSSEVADYKDLNRGDFWLLSDWYYMPILNLFTLTEFDPRPEAIAERFGLSVYQAQNAIQRLLEAKFLTEEASGKLVRTDQKIRFPTDRTFAEIRRHHQKLLQKAKEELRLDSKARFESRLISAVSFAGSSEKIREARLILEEAMYRVANLLSDSPVCDEVFQLNVQLFPLSQEPVKA